MDLDNVDGATDLLYSPILMPFDPDYIPLDAVLPFGELEDGDFRDVSLGPRISSTHTSPQYHYGPVSIRNYLAGHAKKVLRTSRAKDAPEWGDLFLQLPIEVKLLVLEQLHPIDLYHFSQTSKCFRSLILAPKASGVWETAFEHHSAALPKPPPTTSYASWTCMVYGPGICGECGRLGGLTDFAFRKRFCEPCMRTHYSYVNSLRDNKDFPVPADHPVCSLLPRSYRYHGLRYTTSYNSPSNAQYLRNDFDTMMRKVTLIELIIAHNESEEIKMLEELFYEYRDTLLKQVEQINTSADAANGWAMDVYRWCSSEYDTAAREITTRCKKRLNNLGHANLDIDYVQFSITHIIRQDHVYKLTPRAFRKIRPKLESIVTNRKVERLKRERKELIEGIYVDYQKSLVPDRWQYLPPTCLVKDIEGFQDFLRAKFDTRGDISVEYAVSMFPAFIESWTKQQQETILALLPDTEPPEEFSTKLKRLELAKTVITCSDCRLKCQQGRALIGWNAICRHMRTLVGGNHHPCGAYEIQERATSAAASLVSCVGLDPATATAEEMHKRDDRFVCGNCMSETSRGITGLKAYTWLECIVHVIEMHQFGLNAMHDTPAWLFLTPEATTFIKEHEYPHPRPVSPIWHCNKCAIHYSNASIQSAVIEHVKNVHLIEKPIIGVDVVPDKRLPRRRRKAFRLGLDPAYEFKCMRCPKIGITKLWEMQALAEHLLIKHRLVDPVQGEDWVKINVIGAAKATFTAPEPEVILPSPADQQPS